MPVFQELVWSRHERAVQKDRGGQPVGDSWVFSCKPILCRAAGQGTMTRHPHHISHLSLILWDLADTWPASHESICEMHKQCWPLHWVSSAEVHCSPYELLVHKVTQLHEPRAVHLPSMLLFTSLPQNIPGGLLMLGILCIADHEDDDHEGPGAAGPAEGDWRYQGV